MKTQWSVLIQNFSLNLLLRNIHSAIFVFKIVSPFLTNVSYGGSCICIGHKMKFYVNQMTRTRRVCSRIQRDAVCVRIASKHRDVCYPFYVRLKRTPSLFVTIILLLSTTAYTSNTPFLSQSHNLYEWLDLIQFMF